jgi:hypothetical protein
MSDVPEFAAPVLSLPVMRNRTDEYSTIMQRDVQSALQEALEVLAGQCDQHVHRAYVAGLRDGFMQGAMASDSGKAAAVEAATRKAAP